MLCLLLLNAPAWPLCQQPLFTNTLLHLLAHLIQCFHSLHRSDTVACIHLLVMLARLYDISACQ